MKGGKLCARINYETLRPHILGEANNTGTVATCEIDSAGDYVVLQLALKLKHHESFDGDSMRHINREEFYAELPKGGHQEAHQGPFNAVFVGGVCGMIAAAGAIVFLFWRFYVPPNEDGWGYRGGSSSWFHQGRYHHHDDDDDDDDDVEANLLDAKKYDARPSFPGSPESQRWKLSAMPRKRETTEETQTLIQPIDDASGGDGVYLGDTTDGGATFAAGRCEKAIGATALAAAAVELTEVQKTRGASSQAAAAAAAASSSSPPSLTRQQQQGHQGPSDGSLVVAAAAAASDAHGAAAAVIATAAKGPNNKLGGGAGGHQKQQPRPRKASPPQSPHHDHLDEGASISDEAVAAAPAAALIPPDDTTTTTTSSEEEALSSPSQSQSERAPAHHKLKGAARFRAAAKVVAMSVDQMNKHSDGGWRTFDSVQDVPVAVLPIPLVPSASKAGRAEGHQRRGPRNEDDDDRQQQQQQTDSTRPSRTGGIRGFMRRSSFSELTPFAKLRSIPQDRRLSSLQEDPKPPSTLLNAHSDPINGSEVTKPLSSGRQKAMRRSITWSFGGPSSRASEDSSGDIKAAPALMLMRPFLSSGTANGEDGSRSSTDNVPLSKGAAALVHQAFGGGPNASSTNSKGLWKDARTHALVEMHLEGVRDKKGRSALHLAARGNNVEAIRAILDGCEGDHAFEAVDMPDHAGKTPVHLAAEAGSSRAIRELLGHGAVTGRMKKETRLFQRRSRFVNDPSLVTRDADVRGVNAKDRAGNTALHLAAAHGHAKVIRALQETCELEMDVDVQNNKGWTPMQIIASRRDTPLAAAVQLLLSNPDLELTSISTDDDDDEAVEGEEVEGPDDDDNNNKKLMTTTSRRKETKAVSSAKTPLHLASLLGRPELVKAMLNNLRLQELAADHRGFRPQTSYQTASPPPPPPVVTLLSSSSSMRDDIGIDAKSIISDINEAHLEGPKGHRRMTAPDLAMMSFNSSVSGNHDVWRGR